MMQNNGLMKLKMVSLGFCFRWIYAVISLYLIMKALRHVGIYATFVFAQIKTIIKIKMLFFFVFFSPPLVYDFHTSNGLRWNIYIQLWTYHIVSIYRYRVHLKTKEWEREREMSENRRTYICNCHRQIN